MRWSFLWSPFCGNIFLLIIIIHHLLLGKGDVFLSVSSEDPLPREHIFLVIIEYKIPGALSPGVKRSGREAEIQSELQKGEVVKSRHGG
jgi:hypothetical protein